MSKYWNGYRWVDDPPMMRAEPTVEERVALLESEVSPPEVTGEHEPVVAYEMEATVGIKVEKLSGVALERYENGELDDPVEIVAQEAASLAGAIDWTYEEETEDA